MVTHLRWCSMSARRTQRRIVRSFTGRSTTTCSWKCYNRSPYVSPTHCAEEPHKASINEGSNGGAHSSRLCVPAPIQQNDDTATTLRLAEVSRALDDKEGESSGILLSAAESRSPSIHRHEKCGERGFESTGM